MEKTNLSNLAYFLWHKVFEFLYFEDLVRLKMVAKSINSQIDSEILESKKGKKHISSAVIGHVDCGKSTMLVICL